MPEEPEGVATFVGGASGELLRTLQRVHGETRCPLCNSHSWAVPEGIVGLSLGKELSPTKDRSQLEKTGQMLPCVVMVCMVCANMVFLNLVMLTMAYDKLERK